MVFLIASLVLLINVPFGFWRGSVRKFSVAWFVAIHVPVLLSIGLRYVSGIETKFLTILLFVTVFFAGQTLGKYSYSLIAAKKSS